MESIRFEEVTKSFGEKKVTDSLSFSARKGEVFGILGPNGAGKTTIIRQMMGLLTPDRGEISILGLNPETDWKEIRKKVGLVPQETILYPELSARMNLEFQASLFLESTKGMEKKIDEILELVDLSNRAGEKVGHYSGGMKRRLAIGRALLHDPEIIFLDEPTLGVDVQGTHKIWEYIKTLTRSDKTILLSTNVMSEADFLCDNVLIIDQGKHVAEGTPDELKMSLGENELVISWENEADEEIIKQAIPGEFRQRGNTISIGTRKGTDDLVQLIQHLPTTVQISAIELKKPKLDDVFLHYTGRSLRD